MAVYISIVCFLIYLGVLFVLQKKGKSFISSVSVVRSDLSFIVYFKKEDEFFFLKSYFKS